MSILNNTIPQDNLIKNISQSRWPPKGIRGVGFSRANLYGKYFNEYKVEASSPFIVAQIEHIDAINNLDNILNVDGLDAVFIGPYDLSASLNKTGDFNNQNFKLAINKFESFCAKYDIAFGIHIVIPDKNELLKKIDSGYLFNGYGTDAMFLIQNSENPLKSS